MDVGVVKASYRGIFNGGVVKVIKVKKLHCNLVKKVAVIHCGEVQ